MKKFLGFLKGIGVIFAFCIVVFLIGHDFIIKAGMEIGCKVFTGMTLKMDKFSLGLFKSDILIKGLVLKNPRGYKEPVMVSLPELYVDIALADIFKSKLHIKELRLNLDQINIVKNKDGVLNIDKFTKKKKNAKKGKKKGAEVKKAGKEKKNMIMSIDKCSIKLGVISFIDYSGGKSKPDINNVVLGIDEVYSDINNIPLFAAKILQKILRNADWLQIKGFNVNAGRQFMIGALSSLQGIAGSAVGNATVAVATVANGVKDTLNSDSIKNVKAKIKKFGKSLFKK